MEVDRFANRDNGGPRTVYNAPDEHPVLFATALSMLLGAGDAVALARGGQALAKGGLAAARLRLVSTTPARSLRAAAVPRDIMTGGRKFSQSAANRLNQHFGTKLSRREWGRLLEELKDDNGLRNDFHGKLFSDGSYGNGIDDIIGNIGDYLP